MYSNVYEEGLMSILTVVCMITMYVCSAYAMYASTHVFVFKLCIYA